MSNTNNNFNILLVTSALLFFAGTAVQAWGKSLWFYSPLIYNMIEIRFVCKYTYCYQSDLGVVTQNQIQFFTDDVVDKTVDIPLGRMKAMAFDPIKRDLYVRGNNNEFGGIFRIKLTGDHATIAVIEPIIDSTSGLILYVFFPLCVLLKGRYIHMCCLGPTNGRYRKIYLIPTA